MDTVCTSVAGLLSLEGLETDHCRSGRLGSNFQGPGVLREVGSDWVQGIETYCKVGSSLVPAHARLRQDDHEDFEASLDYIVFFRPVWASVSTPYLPPKQKHPPKKTL